VTRVQPEAAPIDGEVRSGPRSRKGVQTRARLLEAAKAIFEENGFLEARISDIAERAGLSHGSFYHYFDSKEQIFREVAELLEERLAEPMYSIVMSPAEGSTARDRLYTAIRRHLESYREEARIMGVIEQVSRYDDHVAGVRSGRRSQDREQIVRSIRQMQRRGVADPSLDPDITAAALGAMTERFAEMWLVQGALDCGLDEAAETLAALFVNGLQMKDPPGGRGLKRT
jgi:AcrR family transcriptional regulator